MNKNRLSFSTRMKLCWDVLTRGKYDTRDYKTILEQEQWEICEKRRKEMDVSCRPREPFPYADPMDEQ